MRCIDGETSRRRQRINHRVEKKRKRRREKNTLQEEQQKERKNSERSVSNVLHMKKKKSVHYLMHATIVDEQLIQFTRGEIVYY